MDSTLHAYPMYMGRNDKDVVCKMHNNCVRNLICSEVLCPKSGLICRECAKLDIHKQHSSKIYTIQQAVNYINQSLIEDNFHSHLRPIQHLQETLSDIILFFKENKVPTLLSLEKSLLELKENLWNSLLITNTRNLLVRIKEISQQNEINMISSLQSLLETCSLSFSRLFTTDLKWYFDLAIQIIIDEFKQTIAPYSNLVNELRKENEINSQRFQQVLLKRLTKLWTVRNPIQLSHGVTNRKNYKQLLANLNDNQHIAYFDWKFIYIYNYKIEKVKATIKTPDAINGILYLEDKNAFVSLHFGSFLRTYGINMWDKETGANLLEAEDDKNVYNIIYIKKRNCFVFDSDDLFGNNYKISIFDIGKKRTIKSLRLPDLNIMDDVIFKYDEQKNLFIVQVIPDTNIPREKYDILFVTFDCCYFNKVSSLPIKINGWIHNHIDQRSLNITCHSVLLNFHVPHSENNLLMTFTPGTRYPLRIKRMVIEQEVLEFGGLLKSIDDNIILMGCRRNLKLHSIYSILIYDTEKNKIIGETLSVSGALALKLMILEKGDVLVVASYDSRISFLKKTLYT